MNKTTDNSQDSVGPKRPNDKVFSTGDGIYCIRCKKRPLGETTT